MFINYAHRGASSYAPENTMSAFMLGAKLGANGIETDVRKTNDDVLVLFHDDNMLRVTGINKKISDFSYSQLSEIQVRSVDGSESDTIPKLIDLLSYAKKNDILLAIEIKDDNIEADVIEAIHTYDIKKTCIVTSFSLEHITKIKSLDKEQRVGLLTHTVNDDVVSSLKNIGAEQICPKESILSPELVSYLHSEGFNVRAWGIGDEEKMKHAYLCGVDGMTVNFPDKLQSFIAQNNL